MRAYFTLSFSRTQARVGEDDAKFPTTTKFCLQKTAKEVRVCENAFLSLHGIKKKMEILQRSLTQTGAAPTDKRDKY